MKEQIVEARLHIDTKNEVLQARIQQLVDDVVDGSNAKPIYVLVDPSTEKELARWQGAPLPPQKDAFGEFLTVGLPAR